MVQKVLATFKVLQNLIITFIISADEDLMQNIFDLFFAGFDTTANMLRWICLYMAAHPEVQKRVQQEIDDVVPRDTLPSTQHKSQ